MRTVGRDIGLIYFQALTMYIYVIRMFVDKEDMILSDQPK